MKKCLLPLDPIIHHENICNTTVEHDKTQEQLRADVLMPSQDHDRLPILYPDVGPMIQIYSTASIVALDAGIQGNVGWHLWGSWGPRNWSVGSISAQFCLGLHLPQRHHLMLPWMLESKAIMLAVQLHQTVSDKSCKHTYNSSTHPSLLDIQWLRFWYLRKSWMSLDVSMQANNADTVNTKWIFLWFMWHLDIIPDSNRWLCVNLHPMNVRCLLSQWSHKQPCYILYPIAWKKITWWKEKRDVEKTLSPERKE